MADKGLFARLQKLFSTNTMVRRTKKGIRVIDTDEYQQISTNLIDRYSRVRIPQYSGGLIESALAFQQVRIDLFRDYDSMDMDPILSAAMDIYADECVGPETTIPLLDGTTRSIKDLYDAGETNFWVYSIDETGKFIPAQCERVAYNGPKEMYRITLDDGTQIDATANHLWVKSNGDLINTSELKCGTSFSDLVNSNNHRVVSVEYIGQRDAYDLVNVGDSHIYAIETEDGSRLFCHNCTTKNEYGNILKIQHDDSKIKDILDNLFYDVLNIEFNLWPWIRNLVKYGDFFLQLEISEELGIVNVVPLSPYETSRVEGFDASNPQRVKFVYSPFQATNNAYTTPFSAQRREYENYEIAHFRLNSDSNFLPYGKSMIEGGRRVWKQLMLMEDAMLIHRIMRAPEKRIFKIDVGNIPPTEVDNYMQKIIQSSKKVPFIDEKTGDYNLKYNMQNLVEDYYMPVRGSDTGTAIDTLKGLDMDMLPDINYLKGKLLAGLKIPKPYLGYEEDTAGKSTLAAMDIRFAKTIERIQRVVISELTKIAIIHLFSQGIEDDSLISFSLELTTPSKIYEQEKLELYVTKVNLMQQMQQTKLFSKKWMYDTIMALSQQEQDDMTLQILDDSKQAFRLAQIETQGVDPAKEDSKTDVEEEIEQIKTELVTKKVGRPKDPVRYGKDDHVNGRDPLGADFMKNEYMRPHRYLEIFKDMRGDKKEILTEESDKE